MHRRSAVAETVTSLVKGIRHRPANIIPIIMAAILGLGVYGFVAIADEVAEGEMAQIDERLFLLFREADDPGEPLGPPWLEETAVEVTAIGGYPLIVLTLAAVVGLFLVTKRYGPALYAVLAVGSGALLTHYLKLYYARPRPDLVDHLDAIHTLSFPSGHAMVTTIAYLTLAALVVRFVDDRRVRIYVLSVAVFVAIIVGLSRIYVGVHWPSDVAAGWALGAAWASLSWLVVQLLQYWRSRSRNG
ncbi:phosphatase PAP2 family protein [Nitratireductor basaltis]|uniref:Phosphoesterase, PA-phosphatase related protein n=1 Tax=Nitratireductor basaltis TaxID=472175 RepID=A0A084U906_9HYPH|nr:phosphatase PAP2 family protein [Nitratireductor basaltis]KFB09442.1 Phosphoesterase, PA-phosphatase related protein [Nitratireductor basaltis]